MSRTEEGPRGRFEGRKRTSDTLCDAPCGSREIKCAPTAYIGASPTGTTACGWTMHVRGPHLHIRSEEHTSELQSRGHLVCRLLLEKKKGRRSSRRATRLTPFTYLSSRRDPSGVLLRSAAV